jgi:allantoinase
VGPRAAQALAAGRRGMRDWAASRPVAAELSAVGTALALARDTGCVLHVVHVSSPAAVGLIAAARREGLDVTCEACPHHLVLEDADAEALGAVAKCAPPLRSSPEREGLWERVVAGEVDLVASDHSPGPPELKRGDDMFAVWGGISGAQTTLPLLLTHGPGHGLSVERAVELVTGAPAARFGLAGKGGLRPGADADIAIVRTGDPWELRAEDLEYRHRQSPFVGRLLTARVVRTILRGVTVFGEGAEPGATGRLVTPG